MFGEKVRALRLHREMTQKELAEKIGVSTRSLINYETGKCHPRQASVVAKLAEALGVTADYLFSDKECMSKTSEAIDAENLVRQLSTLFTGGKLSKADRDAAMQTLQKAYWDGLKAEE